MACRVILKNLYFSIDQQSILWQLHGMHLDTGVQKIVMLRKGSSRTSTFCSCFVIYDTEQQARQTVAALDGQRVLELGPYQLAAALADPPAPVAVPVAPADPPAPVASSASSSVVVVSVAEVPVAEVTVMSPVTDEEGTFEGPVPKKAKTKARPSSSQKVEAAGVAAESSQRVPVSRAFYARLNASQDEVLCRNICFEFIDFKS